MGVIRKLYRFLFTKRLQERGHNLTTLGIALNAVTEPFEVTASLYGDELSKGFRRIHTYYNQYQVLYLALDSDNEFYLTTSPDQARAYIPVTNIYDYTFPRTGALRDEMEHIARTYADELRHFVFNQTHRYIATTFVGGISEVAVVIAPEANIESERLPLCSSSNTRH